MHRFEQEQEQPNCGILLEGTSTRSPRSSKWDEAQRWVINSNSKSNSNTSTNTNTNRGVLIMQSPAPRMSSMKDAATEISPCISRRDMGTQISTNSTSTQSHSLSHSLSLSLSSTPTKNSSPARHNTPTLARPSFASSAASPTINLSQKLLDEFEPIIRDEQSHSLPLGREWFELHEKNKLQSYYYNYNSSSTSSHDGNTSSRGGQVEERWKCPLPMDYSSTQVTISNREDDDEEEADGDDDRDKELRGSAIAWEEAERAKLAAEFKKQEIKIEAWENLERAKAEAELKKLEVKLEKLRAQAIKKMTNKLLTIRKRSKEMRSLASTRQAEQIAKVQERVAQIRNNGQFPSPNLTVCFARLSHSSTT